MIQEQDPNEVKAPKVDLGKAQKALSEEFSLVQSFKYGYRNREDVTILPAGVLIKGSQNVLTNTFARVGIRRGYTLDGQANTGIAPIASSYDWERHHSIVEDRHLRAGFNTTGSNGKLQFRYVAEAGQSWDGNVFTEGQVFWIDIMTSLTSVDFNFAPFWNDADGIPNLLFVNREPSIHNWSGGFTTFAEASNASGVVQTTTLNYGGSGYTVGDDITITGGGGSGATLNVTGVSLNAIGTINATPTAGGAGYSAGFILAIGDGGTGGTVQVTGVGGGGSVTSVILLTQGRNYTTGAGKATTSVSGGTGCTIEILTVVNGAISAYDLIIPGTGYSTGTALATTGGTGTGATVNITVVATGYIKKQGTTTWAQEGFYASNNIDGTPIGTRAVTINGTSYPYTGGDESLYLTGITGNPATPGYPVGTVIFQTVITTTNAEMTNLPSAMNNVLIATLGNQVYLGGEANQNLFLSEQDNYTIYTDPGVARTPGDGGVKPLDGVPVAYVPQEDQMYVSANKSQWYNVSFTLSADLQKESLDINRLKSTGLQAAQSQAYCTKIKNNIGYLSFEPIVNSLGLVQDILSVPQATDLSFPIVNDMNAYNFADGSMFYFKQYLYMAVPREGIVRIYNMTNPENPYWEAPQVLPINRFAVIDGELYGHSSQVGETYKLFTGYNDNGRSVTAVAMFSFNSHGTRTYPKVADSAFTDGYITSNSTLVQRIQYDLDGCSRSVEKAIEGTDTRIVCAISSDASLGKVSLGTNPLGSDLSIENPPLPPYFHVIKTFPKVPFYFESISYTSVGIDQRWDLDSFGLNARLATEGNNAIKE